MLRWLHDAIFVLKYGLSSPVTRCEPSNYCRWVKAKNRNSVMCARACESFFAGFSTLASCVGVGCRTRWGRWVESSPISRKNAQGLSRLLLLFSVGTTSCERVQGWLGDCAALFLRWARRALLSLPERLHTLGALRWVAERDSRCKSHSRDGLRFFCPFSPFRGCRSLFLRPLFLKSGQREGLFREK